MNKNRNNRPQNNLLLPKRPLLLRQLLPRKHSQPRKQLPKSSLPRISLPLPRKKKKHHQNQPLQLRKPRLRSSHLKVQAPHLPRKKRRK